MRRLLLVLTAVVAGVFASSHITPAYAQAARTWVSGVGNDSNDCSRTAPCASFAGALAKTNPGGEINCLDPGGFGAVTITKAISIICENVEAGVLVSGTYGVIVNGGASDIIYLSGLDIEGGGTGLNGIHFNSGAGLYVKYVTIRGFTHGISFPPNASAKLHVTDTNISENSGFGIFIRPQAATAATTVSITRTSTTNNVAGGIRTDNTNLTTGSVNIIIKDSVVSGNGGTGISMYSPGSSSADIMLFQTVVANNGTGGGIRVEGANQNLRMGNSTVSGNGVGIVTANGGVVSSYLTNQIDGNTSNGSTPPTIPLK